MRPEDALGERRQLTVLFCDIVGSTRLSQDDPEDLGRVVAEYQRICGEAVLTQEGHIAQYLGDGVVVYFGYPRSHEDEAQRAVRCGLDILAAVRKLKEAGTFPPEMALDVRLGAHTGRVVVGPVGAGDRNRPSRWVTPPTSRHASNPKVNREPSWSSATTWRIVEGYFTGQSLGERELKGVSVPIELWLVTGEAGLRAGRDRHHADAVRRPPGGTRASRRGLEGVPVRAQSVRPGPGRGRGGRVAARPVVPGRGAVRGGGPDRDAVQSLHQQQRLPPVIEFLERRFQLEHDLPPAERLDRLEEGLRLLGVADAEAGMLLAYLLSLPVGDRYPTMELSPARRRSRTMAVLVDVLAATAQAGPVLLLVEDLHWADTSTSDFLKQLVTTAPSVPLMGVLTARPEVELLAGGTPRLRTIDLSSFGRPEAEAMVREVTLGKALPGEILRKILDRSDGVPLFVEELTCSVLDSGMLLEREASWEATGAPSDEMIPATVDASLTSRIDRLGASRATAQLAATIGREFSLSLLAEVSERDEPTVRRDVERLMQSGLAWAVEGEGDAFQFKHALVRDAAYNSLLRTTRCTHHRRIAAALRQRLSHHVSTRPDLIAHHLTSAGEDEDAIAYWEAAGQMALGRTAVREASKHFRSAIACLSRLESTRGAPGARARAAHRPRPAPHDDLRLGFRGGRAGLRPGPGPGQGFAAL